MARAGVSQYKSTRATGGIDRRKLVALLGGVAAAWPLAARAQRQVMPVIGFLNSGSAAHWSHLIEAFRQGLSESGYVEGRNLSIEPRWANERTADLPTLAAELVTRQVRAIVASPLPAALAAQASTKTIPIVFQIGGDPVKLGLVASFNRPSGNLTGVSQLSTSLIAKRLELLHELVPKAATIATLFDPQAANSADQMEILQQATSAFGLRTIILYTRDINAAFASLAQQQADALFVTASSYWVSHREQIISLAARYRIPATYETREFALDGGLMSYGTNFPEVYRQLGTYTARILNGTKPADLPVQQPTKFDLVINLKTAKALGIEVPPMLLARADEVIE